MQIRDLRGPLALNVLSLILAMSYYGVTGGFSELIAVGLGLSLLWLYCVAGRSIFLESDHLLKSMFGDFYEVRYSEIQKVQVERVSYFGMTKYRVHLWTEPKWTWETYTCLTFYSKKRAIKGLAYLSQNTGRWARDLRLEIQSELPNDMQKQILRYELNGKDE